MKIICPNCTTSYELAAAAVGEAGRSVRCVRCRSVWFVGPDELQAAPAPVAAMPAPAAAGTAGGAGAMDDLAAWGLAEEGAGDAPAAASAGTPAAFDQDANMFSMDSMLADAPGGVTLPNSPPLSPVDDWQGLDAALAPGLGEGIGGEGGPGPERTRPERTRPKRSRRPSMPTVILVLLAVLAALLGWRADVVRVMPQTGSLFAAIGMPVNLRGLAFQDVKTTKELQDGVPVLVVEGRIVNISKLMLEVPRIRFAMRNATGNEVYNWTTLPQRPTLAPNAEQAFRTRLASPPAEGREVVVRFFNRRDALSGLR